MAKSNCSGRKDRGMSFLGDKGVVVVVVVVVE